jgi:hypothetical protein
MSQDPRVVDTGTKFLRAIKQAVNEDFDEDAIAFLDNQTASMAKSIRDKIGGSETRRLTVAYYLGAFFGLKLAARRMKQAAENAASQMNIDVLTGKPIKNPTVPRGTSKEN